MPDLQAFPTEKSTSIKSQPCKSTGADNSKSQHASSLETPSSKETSPKIKTRAEGYQLVVQLPFSSGWTFPMRFQGRSGNVLCEITVMESVCLPAP
jgi:hypothetical protein